MIQLVNSPDNYLPPSKSEMQQCAKDIGLKGFSGDFVRDICCHVAGGEFVSKETYMDDMKDRLYMKYPRISTNDMENRIQNQSKYYSNCKRFIEDIDLKQVPGKTPMNKAMNLLKILSRDDGESSGDSEGNSSEIPLPIFKEGNNHGEATNTLIHDFTSLSDEAKELLQDEDMEDGSGNASGGSGDADRSVVDGIKAMKDHEVWTKIDSKLKCFSEMKMSKRTTVKPDPFSNIIRVRQMKNLSEVSKLMRSELKKPDYIFEYRLVTKQAQIKEKISFEHKKQLLYILLDCSGSMEGDRIRKACGIVFNRLQAVMKEDVKMHLQFFENDFNGPELIAEDNTSAKRVMKSIKNDGAYNGGGTDIQRAVNKAVKRIIQIEKQESCDRPHLVVITDGDDYVYPNDIKPKGTKIHSFIVNGRNKGLKELSKRTAGIYMEL